MSTPSPVPLDNFDPVSPYAPKWARGQGPDAPAATSEPPSEAQHPAGIENEHDARILDEIEASLRAMISANHGGEEPARLSDISRVAGEKIAQEDQEGDEPQASEPHFAEPQAEQSAAEMPGAEPHRRDDRGDGAEMQSVFRDPSTPPWLLPRSLEPAPVPEPWPRPRKRSKSNRLFLRFGLAATGAAVVAAVVIKDVPSLIMEKIRGPIADLSTNAAAVFNEGKASPLQTRMDAVQKEQDKAPAGGLRYAVATADPTTQGRAVSVRTEPAAPVAAEPRKETVMTPWPSPDATKRTEPTTWQNSPARPQVPTQTQAPAPAPAPANEAATNAAAPRVLSAEEIAMLKKMGDDYISAGDFVGARAVLERAADAGDAAAAFAIASTYDPVVLARFKVRGLEPNIVKAEFWYERARVLGSTEAPHRLQAMMAARGN